MEINSIISRLEAEIARLEQGADPSNPVKAEEWDTLTRMEEQARAPRYELSLEDMTKAATVALYCPPYK